MARPEGSYRCQPRVQNFRGQRVGATNRTSSTAARRRRSCPASPVALHGGDRRCAPSNQQWPRGRIRS